MADSRIWFLAFLIQTPFKIFSMLANETLARKILEIFVCERIVLHIDFSG